MSDQASTIFYRARASCGCNAHAGFITVSAHVACLCPVQAASARDANHAAALLPVDSAEPAPTRSDSNAPGADPSWSNALPWLRASRAWRHVCSMRIVLRRSVTAWLPLAAPAVVLAALVVLHVVTESRLNSSKHACYVDYRGACLLQLVAAPGTLEV